MGRRLAGLGLGSAVGGLGGGLRQGGARPRGENGGFPDHVDLDAGAIADLLGEGLLEEIAGGLGRGLVGALGVRGRLGLLDDALGLVAVGVGVGLAGVAAARGRLLADGVRGPGQPVEGVQPLGRGRGALVGLGRHVVLLAAVFGAGHQAGKDLLGGLGGGFIPGRNDTFAGGEGPAVVPGGLVGGGPVLVRRLGRLFRCLVLLGAVVAGLAAMGLVLLARGAVVPGLVAVAFADRGGPVVPAIGARGLGGVGAVGVFDLRLAALSAVVTGTVGGGSGRLGLVRGDVGAVRVKAARVLDARGVEQVGEGKGEGSSPQLVHGGKGAGTFVRFKRNVFHGFLFRLLVAAPLPARGGPVRGSGPSD